MGDTSNRGFARMDPDKQRKIAQMGGERSSGQFGKPQGADPHKAGKLGAEAQSHEGKVKGGKNSHSGRSS